MQEKLEKVSLWSTEPQCILFNFILEFSHFRHFQMLTKPIKLIKRHKREIQISSSRIPIKIPIEFKTAASFAFGFDF